MSTGGDGDGDGDILRRILEKINKLEQDMATIRTAEQPTGQGGNLGNPDGNPTPVLGTSPTPAVPARAAREHTLTCFHGSEQGAAKRGGT